MGIKSTFYVSADVAKSIIKFELKEYYNERLKDVLEAFDINVDEIDSNKQLSGLLNIIAISEERSYIVVTELDPEEHHNIKSIVDFEEG